MRWLKHDATANLDAKLKKLRLKYGMEGYGVYWYCLELIAGAVQQHNLTFALEHDSEILAADTGIHPERIEDMMNYMVDLGLFENRDGTITCKKMASRCDEYTQKLLRTNSGQSTDGVRSNRDLIEQNRTEQNRDTPSRQGDTGSNTPRDLNGETDEYGQDFPGGRF